VGRGTAAQPDRRTPGKARGRRWRQDAGWMANQLGPLLALIVLCAVLAVFSPQFRSLDNYLLLLQQTAPWALIAAGQTFVMLTGGMDLSVGSLGGLASVVSALWISGGIGPWHSMPVALAIGGGIAFGLAVGLVQGLIITKLKIPPFILSLGSYKALAGLALVLSNGSDISVDSANGTSWDWIYAGSLFGIPAPLYIALAVYAIGWLVLRYTRLGRYTYAIGGNEQAVRLSGVTVDRYKIIVYAICGLLAGMAGMLIMASSLSGSQSNLQSAELDSIAACVIGGVSLSGGSGSIWGSLIGAIILVGVVPNALVMLSVSDNWNNVVLGGTVVLAVLVDVLRKRLQK
jgi:ribose transport system permease protein